MRSDVEYRRELDIVRVGDRGWLTPESLERTCSEALRCAVENGCRRILHDVREARLDFGPVDVFALPEQVPPSLPAGPLRLAVVYSSDVASPDRFGFLETVFRDRGFLVSVFTDEQTAVQWLDSGD